MLSSTQLSAIALVFDPKGHIVRCNSSFEQTTGYTFNEVTHQPFWDLFCNQDERESVQAVFEQVQQDWVAIAHAHEWTTKSGSRCRIAWDYTPFLNSDGTFKYAITTGNDITQS